MSGNRAAAATAAAEKMDRRVRRTRDRLGDALIGLLLEKAFDAITVQDVLDRAGVGRSTFYAHFRDKEDLFVSDMDEFLEETANALSRRGDASERVLPVRELFAHLAEMQRLHRALVASSRIHDFLDLAQAHFARGIERRLSEIPRGRRVPPERRVPLAQALAGALLALLSGWIDRGMPETPEELDLLYHRLVWRGVADDAVRLA